MLLGNLLKSIDKDHKKINIKGISFDSRKVKKNYVFFAIKGERLSGIDFIKEAILKGASVIVSEERKIYKTNKVVILVVKDIRKSLTEACSNFYKKKPKNIIAVTGTNGKSSVADFFYQILKINKISVASIGTLGINSKKYNKRLHLTTVDPLLLHQNLEILAKNKIKYLILEASSHGLKQKRLNYLNIKIGIFTNFSHDHLDYHSNMNSYLNSKLYLFKNLLTKKSTIITDKQNNEFRKIKNIANDRNIKILTIGSDFGNIKILNVQYKEKKQIVTIEINSKIYVLKIPLIGFFQLKNLFMAVLAATQCGISEMKILKKIHQIKSVPGRLECVANLKNNSNIIVDYAHTPDALEKSLIDIKKQFKKNIIIVFGCGGDRDRKKRVLMGKVAKKHCRKIFITDDNPRYENPKKIREAIIKSCRNLAVDIGNRKIAIKKAIQNLRENEILLVAGKGHEKDQNYGNKIIKFCDKKIIKEIVKNKNFSSTKYSYQNSLLKKVFSNKNLTNVTYSGVSINTKTIKKNNLFFAIKGKNNDGHRFLKEAFKKGAIRSVISKKLKTFSQNKIIPVKNTLHALNNLAKFTRDRTSAKIVGITGSVGKTTLKNLIAFSLEKYGKVYKSPHSYNNKFGVPLSLSNLKSNTKYGIFEIGMDKKGEINSLSNIVKPEIAVITNISEAHIQNFNTLKDIAKAKAEIIQNITKGGNIILNKDDKFFNYLSNLAIKNKIKITSFSSTKKADIKLLKIKKFKNTYKLKIIVKKNIFHFETKLNNKSFINNLLACISVLSLLNLNLNKLKKKFKKFYIPSGRGDIINIKKFNKTFKLIDESYNANPLSMASAINNVNSYKKKRNTKKLVFLGDMLELGKRSKKFHKELSFLINRTDIDKVFVYGSHIRETFKHLSKNKKGKMFNSLSEAYGYLSKIVHNNDLLMIKGSNATGLNNFTNNIKKGQNFAI